MQPWMYGIESPGEKAIFFQFTATVKLRKEIIGDRISLGILTRSILSSNSYLAISGKRCTRLKLPMHSKLSIPILPFFQNMAMLQANIF